MNPNPDGNFFADEIIPRHDSKFDLPAHIADQLEPETVDEVLELIDSVIQAERANVALRATRAGATLASSPRTAGLIVLDLVGADPEEISRYRKEYGISRALASKVLNRSRRWRGLAPRYSRNGRDGRKPNMATTTTTTTTTTAT